MDNFKILSLMTELQLIAQAIDIAEYQDVVLQEEDNAESQDTEQQNADSSETQDVVLQEADGVECQDTEQQDVDSADCQDAVPQGADNAEAQDVVLQEEDNAESQDTEQQNADTVKGGDVYIQDIKGKLWKTCDWDDSVRPNAIAVITKEAKFLIALTQLSSKKLISGSITDPFEIHMTAISNSIAAKADYEGAKNTANIIKLQPSKHHAVGYCNAFTFPDGKTKGFMPSLGQLWIAYQNKTAVEDALYACGGDVMYSYYWSSTFGGVDDGSARRCWHFDWDDGSVCRGRLWCDNYVRPFADFND